MVEGGVTVNWIRMVLDGFMMAAYFNLFAAAVAVDPLPVDGFASGRTGIIVDETIVSNKD